MSKFNLRAALFTLVSIALLAEAYWFGFSAKACNGLDWGGYGVAVSALLFTVFPYNVALLLGGAIVFVAGGILARTVRLPSWLLACALLTAVLAVSVIAFAASPRANQACSAL